MKRSGRRAKRCPCTSGALYQSCCQPYHRGAPAPDAVTLMRARFSAFALGDGGFLWDTLHPDHPLRARPELEVVRELSTARQRLRYQRLTVHSDEQTGSHASVRFTAHVFERGRDRSFRERSEFVRVDGGWRYLAGTLEPGEP